MILRPSAALVLVTILGFRVGVAQDVSGDIPEGMEESAEEHMREELGVNEVTAPQIQKLLFDLDSFQPIPMALVESTDLNATYPNRFQTALNFGGLVADGFVIVINKRAQDIQNIGRALIKQARALGVGDSLTRRAASLIDLGQRGDWGRLREELIRTQNDVEAAMMNLHDEELAHLISFGGWLRGFQLAANATANNYTPARAEGLRRLDVMSYFVDRLDTLNPRLKRTELVSLLIAKMKTIRQIAGQAENRPPSESEVKEMRDLANEMVAAAQSKVDDEGNLLDIQQ